MLSIIVTHYRTPALLKSCLKSIKENIDGIEYELIILDSQSEKKTRDMIEEEYPQAKIIHFSENVANYGKLVNSGIEVAKGDYVLILNHDIVVLGDAIKKLIEYMEENSRVGIIGPQLLTFSNEVQKSCFRFPTISSVLVRRTFLKNTKWGKKKLAHFLIEGEDLDKTKAVDWIQASAMLVRREGIDKVGLWDERYPRYFEDTDWCRRFWQEGYRVIYLPSAQMSHYYGRHSKKWGAFLDIFLNKYSRMHLASFVKYLWKWRKG